MNQSVMSRPRGGIARRLLPSLAVFLMLAASLPAAEPPAPAAAPAEPAAPAAPAADTATTEAAEATDNVMSSVLGPGSAIEAGENGEFDVKFNDQGDLEYFRAIRDVVLITDDFDMVCDDFIYRSEEGKITALAGEKGLVHINMRGMAPGAGATKTAKGTKGDTKATCRKYEFFVNEKKHVLTNDVVVNMRDKSGRTSTITGPEIIITQSPTGATQMHIPREPFLGDPSRRKDIRDLRRLRTGQRPTVLIDMPAMAEVPAGASGSEPARIDAGNVNKLQRPKPSRQIKIESRD